MTEWNQCNPSSHVLQSVSMVSSVSARSISIFSIERLHREVSHHFHLESRKHLPTQEDVSLASPARDEMLHAADLSPQFWYKHWSHCSIIAHKWSRDQRPSSRRHSEENGKLIQLWQIILVKWSKPSLGNVYQMRFFGVCFAQLKWRKAFN